MSNLNDFRIINDFERTIIRSTLSKICKNYDKFLNKYQELIYISFNRISSEFETPSIYLLLDEHMEPIKKFEPNIQIISAGLYLGFITKNEFRISLEGAEFLVKNEFFSNEQFLILNNKGEKSILYGNDIKKENVIKFPKNFRKDDFIVILNSNNEICAISQLLISKNELPKSKSSYKIARNLLDKGYYLRKKQ